MRKELAYYYYYKIYWTLIFLFKTKIVQDDSIPFTNRYNNI